MLHVDKRCQRRLECRSYRPSVNMLTEGPLLLSNLLQYNYCAM